MADLISPGSAPPRSLAGRTVDYYRSVVGEMRKVTWPDFPQVRSATIAIIIFVLLIGMMITIMDFILNGVLVRWLPSLFLGH